MRFFTILATVVLLALGLGLLSTPDASASNAIAKREGAACTSCHDKPGSKLLTDRGKYYELTASLDGFDEFETTLGRCTACHIRKPGSLDLTKKGRHFKSILDDMDGLRKLVLDLHPSARPADGVEGAPGPDGAADGGDERR